MEATARDGGARGPSWRYRRSHEEIGSSSYTISSSSRSGTIVSSTAYTSGASRLSSGISTEAALHLDMELELRLGTPGPDIVDAEFGQAIKKPRKLTWKVMRMKRIVESLVQEFFCAPSENRSISALERWFSELGVSWVLQLDIGGASETYPPLSDEIRISWARALTLVMETIHGFMDGEDVDSGGRATSLDSVQFALFFQKAITKMLVFVDVVFSKSLCGSVNFFDNFYSYLDIYKALSKALSGIRLQFHSPASAEVETIEKEMVSLMSAKQGKAFHTIWSFMEEERTRALKSTEDSLGVETAQGSSYIHHATFSIMDHINFFLNNCDPLFVSQAANLGKYVPQTGLQEAQPVISLITEMVSCLEEKLITKSQLFIDKGLGLLFLLNNSDYIREQLQHTRYHFGDVVRSITSKVEHYIESYIQVSWAPMLSLFNPTRFRRKYSPVSKFESEFQKTYTTQKLWKVPDPELRKRLRKAIIEKIVPGYTKYIEDSKVTNPKFTPQELEKKLQELFEG